MGLPIDYESMETKDNQVSNLETCASRYVLAVVAYNALKDPHLKKDEKEAQEKVLHGLLDIAPEEFEVIGQIVKDHVELR